MSNRAGRFASDAPAPNLIEQLATLQNWLTNPAQYQSLIDGLRAEEAKADAYVAQKTAEANEVLAAANAQTQAVNAAADAKATEINSLHSAATSAAAEQAALILANARSEAQRINDESVLTAKARGDELDKKEAESLTKYNALIEEANTLRARATEAFNKAAKAIQAASQL